MGFPYSFVVLRPCWLRLADAPLPREALARCLRESGWLAHPLDESATAWHPTPADAEAFARLRREDPSATATSWPTATWTEDAPPTVVLTPWELACFVSVRDSAWRVPAGDDGPLLAIVATVEAIVGVLAGCGVVEQRIFPREPWRPLDMTAWRTTVTVSESEPAWSGWLGLELTPLAGRFDLSAIRDRLRRYWGHVEHEGWHYLTDGNRTPAELRGHTHDSYLASAPAFVLGDGYVRLSKSHGHWANENGNRHDFLRWLISTWPCRGQCGEYGIWWPRGIAADHLVAAPIDFDPAWLDNRPVDPHGPAPAPLPSPSGASPAELCDLADGIARAPALVRWLLHGSTFADGDVLAPARIVELFGDLDADSEASARLLTSLLLLRAGPIRPRALDLGLVAELPARLRRHTQLVTLHVQAQALDRSWRAWLGTLPELSELHLSDVDEPPDWLDSLAASIHTEG